MRPLDQHPFSLPFAMKTVACLEQLIDRLYCMVQLSIYRINEQLEPQLLPFHTQFPHLLDML